MIIRCISDSGLSLRPYEYEPIINKYKYGRFGACEFTEFGGIEVGREYLVMGLVVFEAYQGYLIDDNGFISVNPCQLFEVIDNKLGSNWHFRLIGIEEYIYPYIQAVFGYCEFCSDKMAYQNLIVEKEYESQVIYFKRKIELENELAL